MHLFFVRIKLFQVSNLPDSHKPVLKFFCFSNIKCSSHDSVRLSLNQELGCPYLGGVEDSWIEELLFKPGEPRLRLLQWSLAK